MKDFPTSFLLAFVVLGTLLAWATFGWFSYRCGRLPHGPEMWNELVGWTDCRSKP